MKWMIKTVHYFFPLFFTIGNFIKLCSHFSRRRPALRCWRGRVGPRPPRRPARSVGLLPCHILPPLLPLLYFSGAATMPGSSSMNTHLRRVSSLAGQLRNLASIARSVLRGIVIVLLIFLVLLGGGVATLLAALHSPTFVPLLAGAATALLGGIVYLKWVEADELVGTLQLWSGGDLEQPPPGLAGSPEVEARESRARRSVRSSASGLARVRSEGTLVPLIKEKEAALAAAEAAWRSARAERTRSIKTALMLAPDNMLLSVATTLMGVPAAVAGVASSVVATGAPSHPPPPRRRNARRWPRQRRSACRRWSPPSFW